MSCPLLAPFWRQDGFLYKLVILPLAKGSPMGATGLQTAHLTPCVLQNLPVALVCPKEPPCAACLSKIWTPLGVLAGFHELTISRTGGRRPLGLGQQAAKPGTFHPMTFLTITCWVQRRGLSPSGPKNAIS